MIGKKSIFSLLEEISNSEERLRRQVTLPNELRDFCDEFYEKYFSEETSNDEKKELSKLKGCVLYVDSVYPIIMIMMEYIYRINNFSVWKFIIHLGREHGKKADKEVAFNELTNLNSDGMVYNNLLEYLELGEEFKLCIQKKDKYSFTQLLATTDKADDLLYACGYMQILNDLLGIWGEIVFGDYLPSEIEKVKKGYLLPTIMKSGSVLYYGLKDMFIGCEEFIPYEYAKKLLRDSILLYCLYDKELMLDTEKELIEEAAGRAQKFEDAFYPTYFSVLIEIDGDLNGYIDYWIGQNGEDCGEVRKARAYMNQLEIPEEDITTKKGRKQGCWLKGKPKAEEHSWAIKIQTKVWDKTLELARSFDYVELLTEKKAEKKYKEMAAALIYKSAEIIGVANPWDSGVQSSYERTMSFAKIDRRYLKKYLDILDYYLIAKEFQIRENHFLYRKNEYNDNIVADYQEEDDDSNYALSIYQSRTKHIFPSGNDMKQLRERRSELIQSLADSGTMANFISINFKAIGSALSIVKQIMKKIK